METRRLVAGVHVLLAAVRVYWATGATWPAVDQRSLSLAVLGSEVSFAPGVVLPLAAFHLFLALAVSKVGQLRLARVVVALLAAGLAVRAMLGVVWVVCTDSGTAFWWLNLFFYTPACVALLLLDVSLVRPGRLRHATVSR
jgi:uncharacterized protein DUF3995